MTKPVDRSSPVRAIMKLGFLFLFVVSVVFNFLLWRWGDTQATQAEMAQSRLVALQSELRVRDEQAVLMKSMLGLGALTQAEIDVLTQAASGSPEMDAIGSSFARDMDLFAAEVDVQNRNYPALATYLSSALENYRSGDGAAGDAESR